MSIKKHIPNALTLANLLFGLLAIIQSFNYSFRLAFIFIAIALVMDFLDGTAARLLRVKSTLGKELDSLADVVSFGVGPGLILFNYWSLDMELVLGIPIAYIALTIPLFAAYRLAVFNSTEQSTEYFKGLPTPAFAAVAFTLPMASESAYAGWMNSPIFILAFSIFGGLLMVGNMKLLSFKIGNKDRTLNITRLVLLLLFALSLAIFKFFGAILCLLIYLVISLTIQKRFNKL